MKRDIHVIVTLHDNYDEKGLKIRIIHMVLSLNSLCLFALEFHVYLQECVEDRMEE
jgi:hypothetical protein